MSDGSIHSVATGLSDEPSFLEQRAQTRLTTRSRPDSNTSQFPSSPVHQTFSACNPFDESSDNYITPVNWASLQQVYPMLSVYGGATCIYPAQSYFALGTSRACILILNHKQILQTILGPQDENFRSPVERISVSSDGTHVAASYQSGDVFIWNLNGGESHERQLLPILNITAHKGCNINGLGFVGKRHTAMVISDDSGAVLYHTGFRNHLWQLTYRTKVILNVANEGQILQTAISPATGVSGNNILRELHLLATVSQDSFALISMNSHLVTQYLEKTPKNDSGNSSPFRANISWDHSGTKVAYSLNKSISVFVLTGEKVNEEKLVNISKRETWNCQEEIINVQWVSEDLIGILTNSNELIVLTASEKLEPIAKVDLLSHDILTPSERHFACFKRQIFLLTSYTLKLGKFLSWSDVILHYVQNGNYIPALETVGFLLSSGSSLAQFVNLEVNLRKRKKQLEQPFRNLSLASLKYLLSKKECGYEKLFNLFSLILEVDNLFSDSLEEQVNFILDEPLELFNEEQLHVFYDVLSNKILEGAIKSLPPSVLKRIITYYAEKEEYTLLEDLIVMLDPQFLDLDLAVKLCKEFKLYEVLIYLWNKVFTDYMTPLVDFIYRIKGETSRCLLFNDMPDKSVSKVFDYLSFVLTGRQYPTDIPVSPPATLLKAKLNLFYVIFSGASIEWPENSLSKLYTCDDYSNEPAFPYLNLLLKYDAAGFLSMLNEVFEDSFLNEENGSLDEKDLDMDSYSMKINRQYIVDILLDAMKSNRDSRQNGLIAIFITRNIPKYPQFIKLSGHTIDGLVSVICNCNDSSLRNDAQRSLESLFTYYRPMKPDHLITFVKECGFDRVLFSLYRKTQQYSKFLELRIKSDELSKSCPLSSLEAVELSLRDTASQPLERKLIIGVIENNFERLIENHVQECVRLFNTFAPDLHKSILDIDNEYLQKQYLDELIRREGTYRAINKEMGYLYFELLCKQNDQLTLNHCLQKIDINNFDIQRISMSLKSHENFEGNIIIFTRLRKFSLAMNEVVKALGISLNESFDSIKIDKYVQLGIEICDNVKLDKEQLHECCTKFLVSLIANYGKLEQPVKDTCNLALQKVFVKLADLNFQQDTENGEPFWDILTDVLENQELILMKLHDMRTLLQDIFTAYSIEECIKKLILKMVNDSSSEILENYKNKLSNGWSIHNHECEVCGKKVWGVGLDSRVFSLWENKQRQDPNENIFVQDCGLVVFKCHHGFHQMCLTNLGQTERDYACLICMDDQH